VPVDFSPSFPADVPAFDLPTYPFQRSRYWHVPGRKSVSGDGDARFWELVERGDPSGLAAVTGTADEGALAAVLSSLSAWRGERRRRARTEGWRCRGARRMDPFPTHRAR